MEDLAVPVGPMSVRLESLHADSSSNYMSFLHQSQKAAHRGRSDKDSIHSVSSVRSVMSGMSSFWSSIGLGGSSSKSEKAKAAAEADLKYVYSAFTKIPCLRLSPDHRARLIRGYEEFPFDTAVPLYAFKNVSALEVVDVDFRQFFGWDRLAEQLVWLTVKRSHLEDVGDLLTGVVLDDADKRRRRSTKNNTSPTMAWVVPERGDIQRSNSDPGSPVDSKFGPSSPQSSSPGKDADITPNSPIGRPLSGSISPGRPLSRPSTSYRHMRTNSRKIQRSGSGSSNGSEYSTVFSNGSSNVLAVSVLPASKWRFLKYLSLADNSLTAISAESLLPVTGTLRSLDLSSNLFAEVPDSLACLTALRSLDLSNCMIESLHCLTRNPLPAVTVLKLRSNRLKSLAGVERLLSLERLDLADNQLSDPEEIARLTSLPNLREVWVKHNPFTRTHANYRLTIFNLFRKTPGYLEDIIIDNSGPGYSERKFLVERAPEPERPPVMRKVSVDAITPIIVQPTMRPARPDASESERVVLEVQRTQSYNGQPDLARTTSTRKKKTSRRRIVDLSQDEIMVKNKPPSSYVLSSSTDQASPPSLASAEPRSKDPVQPALQRAESKRSTRSGRSGTVRAESNSPTKPTHTLSLNETHVGIQWNLSEDEYRRKIEALKNEMGSNWLSVLGEQTWDSSRDHSSQTSPVIAPVIPPMIRTNSQAIVSGGRTIG